MYYVFWLLVGGSVCLADFVINTAGFLPHFYPFKIHFTHSVPLFLLAFLSLIASNFLQLMRLFFPQIFNRHGRWALPLSTVLSSANIGMKNSLSWVQHCILPHFYSAVKYKTQRKFYKLWHCIFILGFLWFFVCLLYLVSLCTWMDRRILPICWKCMFNLPK